MDLVRGGILHLSKIPKDLDSVITIDSQQETDPRELEMSQADVDTIWDNIVKLYKCGVHPGISVSIRRRGEGSVSTWRGTARRSPWST